ncbi:glycine zipper 2TM domain-containing protein [Massilia forsythiae]|uniref:Glycine zipper 2TM domain-containing protein n=1 Tax=Massilia forsythiae TaxID=2728020 RepID=A0A7Z2VX79_9BURK|nr:glycine zipper 2TM domain-containing protein [Massilia forsythiae]QJE01126.1 glycine zipper 2TM domain-containing protein [Massilia forsythiae]
MATTRQTLAAAMVAALPLLTAAVPAPAQAQNHPRVAAIGPRIEDFNVDSVRRLDPGTELNFDLHGSPGGDVTLRIDGATRNLHMTETRPGTYQGTYTIGTHDRIRPGSSVTANLRAGGRVATQVLGEALVRGPGRDRDDRSGQLATVPRVDRFDVRGSDDLGPGNELRFSVFGTPGAKVDIQIAGTRGIVTLPEVRPGEYSGLYTIRRDDRIAPDAAVTATIRNNGRYATASLGRPLLTGGPVPRPVRDVPPPPRDAGQGPRDGRDNGRDDGRVARYCTNCATVEAVNMVHANGEASALGTLGGAAVGGLLGNQVGSGNGRTAATVAGAVGGALAGRSIERNARSGDRFEVVVRYENGATQTVPFDNDPGFRAGDRVKVDNGVLVRDQ